MKKNPCKSELKISQKHNRQMFWETSLQQERKSWPKNPEEMPAKKPDAACKKKFQSLASGTIKCQADPHLWEKLFIASGGKKVSKSIAVV